MEDCLLALRVYRDLKRHASCIWLSYSDFGQAPTALRLGFRFSAFGVEDSHVKLSTSCTNSLKNHTLPLIV